MTDTVFTEAERQSNDIGFLATPEIEFIEVLSACWSLGPLSACVDKIGDDEIKVSIKLSGVTIGSGKLSVQKDSLCASANVGLAKAKICVVADFRAKEVSVKGEVCTLKFPSGWSCRKFSARILSW